MRICNIGVQILAPCNGQGPYQINCSWPKETKKSRFRIYCLSSIVGTDLTGNLWSTTDGLSRPNFYSRWHINALCCGYSRVDCHINPPYQNDIVMQTEWTEIALQDVLHDAILPYAFSTSSYPLILSIENHCTREQQDKMAHHFKNILGNLLYTQPVDTSRWTNVKYFLKFWKDRHS